MKLTLYAWAAAIALGVASAKCDPADSGHPQDWNCVAATVGILDTCADMVPCTGARPVLCPCPAGCQDALDTLYDTCGGTCWHDGSEWDTNIRTMSDQINAAGCSSAEMVRHDPYVPS